MTKLNNLLAWMAKQERIVVAYSGGVDSSLVLATATQTLGRSAVAVMAVSPSLPESERLEALELAAQIGATVTQITTHETEDSRYQANALNRCYFCKSHVYSALKNFAASLPNAVLVDGMNAEDTLDLRPGRAAARELEVHSPLHDLGFSKADVREAARSLGLPNWNKPAAACLASRIPYGTQVTNALLSQVERAEAALKPFGFKTLRVRHHGDLARVEVPPEDFGLILEQRSAIHLALLAAGYTYSAMDLMGFRSGSANEVISQHQSS